jgi:hypothetical protein
MTARKTGAQAATANVHDLTPAEIQTLLTHIQNLSRCKPRQSETILKLARAQVAITEGVKPYEQSRQDLLNTLPPAPNVDTPQEEKLAYSEAKAVVDKQFQEIYLKSKFRIQFPDKLTNAELQHFAEPPNPNDLAALHPYMVDLGETAAVEKRPRK